MEHRCIQDELYFRHFKNIDPVKGLYYLSEMFDAFLLNNGGMPTPERLEDCKDIYITLKDMLYEHQQYKEKVEVMN